VSASLRVEVDARPFHRVPADVLLVPFFVSDPPARGPFSWVDWRLCGLLSQKLRSDQIDLSNAALLAPSSGRTRVNWVLALGLGDRAAFGEDVLLAASETWVERVAALQAGAVALTLPPGGLSPERASQVMLRGLLRGLAAQPWTLCLRLLLPPENIRETWKALDSDLLEVQRNGVAVELADPADPESKPDGASPVSYPVRERAAAARAASARAGGNADASVGGNAGAGGVAGGVAAGASGGAGVSASGAGARASGVAGAGASGASAGGASASGTTGAGASASGASAGGAGASGASAGGTAGVGGNAGAGGVAGGGGAAGRRS